MHLLVFSRVLPTSLGTGAPSNHAPTIHYAVPIIHLANHILHYTRLDCFAGWRLRRYCCLLFSIVSFRHCPPLAPLRKRQHVYTHTVLYRGLLGGIWGGGGLVDGRTGYRVLGSEARAFNTESSRFKSLPIYINSVTNIPTLQYCRLLWFLLLLPSLLLVSPTPDVFGLTTPCLACLLAFIGLFGRLGIGSHRMYIS